MELRGILVIVAGAAALLAGCAFPTHDPSKLKAIEAESRILVAEAAESKPSLPESGWPPVIASLDAEFVTVRAEGVDILVEPYFDGGWGYFVPKEGRDPAGPPGRYSYLGQGVYWYHPY